MIKLVVILIFIINDKFYVVEDDFIIIEKFRHVYQFVINFLMYIMLNTRSNIVFTILMIFQYNFNFNVFH